MIDKLSQILPNIKFCKGDQFCWSPKEQTITYPSNRLGMDGEWALLHETGHAVLQHQDYKNDYELLIMEVEAWQKAKEIAKKLGVIISETHIQECLDSYRDWLYARSICPKCGIKTIQKDLSNNYCCFNCHTNWQVSPSLFCRSYRSVMPEEKIVFI